MRNLVEVINPDNFDSLLEFFLQNQSSIDALGSSNLRDEGFSYGRISYSIPNPVVSSRKIPIKCVANCDYRFREF